MPMCQLRNIHNVSLDNAMRMAKNNFMFACQIEDSLGNTTQGVTVMKNTIFNSNEQFGMPLNQEGFNQSVLDPAFISTAVSIVKAAVITKEPNFLGLFRRVIICILCAFTMSKE